MGKKLGIFLLIAALIAAIICAVVFKNESGDLDAKLTEATSQLAAKEADLKNAVDAATKGAAEAAKAEYDKLVADKDSLIDSLTKDLATAKENAEAGKAKGKVALEEAKAQIEELTKQLEEAAQSRSAITTPSQTAPVTTEEPAQ